MVKLRHFDNVGTARFVTFNCYRNEHGFQSESSKSDFLIFLNEARDNHKFKIFGYVIMPTHVHLILYPPDGMKLGLVIGEIKSRFARHILSKVKKSQDSIGVFWQKRCYDHNCRTPETVIEKINYCHTDPVRSGIVQEQSQWKWSSYNWYNGEEDVPLIMDEMK